MHSGAAEATSSDDILTSSSADLKGTEGDKADSTRSTAINLDDHDDHEEVPVPRARKRDYIKLVGGIALKILLHPIMLSTLAGITYSMVAYSVDPGHEVPMIVYLPFKWLSDCMYGIGLFNVCCRANIDCAYMDVYCMVFNSTLLSYVLACGHLCWHFIIMSRSAFLCRLGTSCPCKTCGYPSG